MLILGLDTSHASCSVAVCDSSNAEIMAHSRIELQRGHAELLPQMISETIDEACVRFADIGKIAVTTGPGAFTGVRIGLSMARGLALALNIPIVGIGSLATLAANIEDNEMPVLASFDARRGEVYLQLFDNGTALTDPQICRLSKVADMIPDGGCIVVGTAAKLLSNKYNQLQPASVSPYPDAGRLCKLAIDLDPSDFKPVPLYLRQADAKPQSPLVTTSPVDVEITTVDAHMAVVIAQMHAQAFARPWGEEELASLMAANGAVTLMAKAHDQPNGFVLARKVADEAEIITIAVNRQSRRRHIADRLLQDLITRLQHENIKKIFLEVGENNFAARKLYEKAGFSACGVRKAYYTGNDGQKEDAITMALQLSM